MSTEEGKLPRLVKRTVLVESRFSGCRPCIPWEEPMLILRDLETGVEYRWWSDKTVTCMYEPCFAGSPPDVGDILTISATPRYTYGDGRLYLRAVRIHSTIRKPE